MLQLSDVRFGFPTRADFLGPVTLTVNRGECWAIVGPNGAGKSTLLRLIAGLSRPSSGRITLEGTPLSEFPNRERAKRIAFVPQNVPTDLDSRAGDVVLMGRYPHRSLGLFESAEDYRIAEAAMARTETLAFSDRVLATLSGGEAQRIHVAAALAQGPQLLLLDEPTASLDLQHQLAVFGILANQARGADRAVVAVTHDVNLAINFCTHVLLLHNGGVAACGSPKEVLRPEVLEPVYRVSLAAASAREYPGHRWLLPVEHGEQSVGAP